MNRQLILSALLWAARFAANRLLCSIGAHRLHRARLCDPVPMVSHPRFEPNAALKDQMTQADADGCSVFSYNLDDYDINPGEFRGVWLHDGYNCECSCCGETIHRMTKPDCPVIYPAPPTEQEIRQENQHLILKMQLEKTHKGNETEKDSFVKWQKND